MKKIFIYSISVLIIWCCFITAYILYIGTYQHKIEKADVIIVLGAAVYGQNPSPVFTKRIQTAIELYNNKFAPKIIFTGGKKQDSDVSESKVALNYATRFNVNHSDVFIEEKSNNTKDNLKEALKIMKKNNLQSAILVSDHFHLPRAKLLSLKLGFKKIYLKQTIKSKINSINFKILFFTREFILFHKDLIASFAL